jgi:hypothetical protein
MSKLTADAVKAAILKWPGLYETKTGEKFYGMPVSQVPSQLVDAGWRNVSRLDGSDFSAMGLRIVTARYVGGAHAKRFCDVVVASGVPHTEHIQAWKTFSHDLSVVDEDLFNELCGA